MWRGFGHLESANILTQNSLRVGSNGLAGGTDTGFVTKFEPLNGCEKTIMDRQTLSIMKACEAVGVSRRTIYNWIGKGTLDTIHVYSSQRVLIASVDLARAERRDERDRDKDRAGL